MIVLKEKGFLDIKMKDWNCCCCNGDRFYCVFMGVVYELNLIIIVECEGSFVKSNFR